ncbi:MAG: glutamate formimidoyltransferase [Candidatus Izimaplasma sp.]|nr:glutamate formimidoyltransferase [Candidatus Izimaplasma bacterium]
MTKIVQCVPNFSEGRNQDSIDDIVSVLKDKTGFKCISVEPDADYNRTVVTLLGDPEAIVEALPAFVEKVLNHIDMNEQSGEHPRMGAVDVIPFIPIENVTMADCVMYANQIAHKIWEQFKIPSFMYAEAATTRLRKKLPTIRKGEFEGMKTKIKEEKWHPDYGNPDIHPTFGVIGIGARIPLIAYNIDLDTDDINIAKKISRAIRFSSGGYRFIQAGPVMLDSRGHVQVTMNILNYQKNPIYRILETVKMEAKRYHVAVPSCELVGLAPKATFIESLTYYFELNNETVPKQLTSEEIVSYAKKYMGFRELDTLKIIEANL